MGAQRRAERGVQRRRAGTSPQLLAVVLRQWRGTGRQRPVEAPEDLDRSKLSRLQSGGRFEWIAELEKSLRRQRLEHAQLQDQQLVDAGGAVQRRHRALWAAGLQLRNRAVELVEDHLEPELVGLVNDHEQQLVVRALGERMLEIEQLVDAQVRAVVSTGHDRAGTLRSLPPPPGGVAASETHDARVTRMSSSENSSGGES